MPTATGYGIYIDYGAAGPDAGDEISGGYQVWTIDTTNDTVLGTGDVYYPTLGDVSGIFYLGSDGFEYFVPDDPTGFPPYELGSISTFTDAITGTAGDDTLLGTAEGELIIGDEHFNPTGTGNDTIDGGGGDDTIHAGDGADSLTGGTGNDRLTGGDGDDTFVFATGDGSDIVTDFDMGDTDGDGFTNDQLDVSALLDVDGNPIEVRDVVVSDDGSGNAVLTFPGGEQITLLGVDPVSLTNATLVSMGVPCFASGTRIAVPGGWKAVEDLKVGDLVHTEGQGPQPILWCAMRSLDARTLDLCPNLLPIRIRAGALGNRCDLLLSAQHRVVVGQEPARAGLVPARWLAEDGNGRFRVAQGRQAVTYHHFLLPRHAIVLAEGARVESFFPGPEALRTLAPCDRERLFGLIPALLASRGLPDTHRVYGPFALPLMPRAELRAVLSERGGRLHPA